MIEEVVNSILEAEDVAAKRVVAAQEEAAEIVAVAEKNAEVFKKQVTAQVQADFAKRSQQIVKDLDNEVAQKLEQLNAESDKDAAAYRKKTDEAVKVILEQIL